MSRCVGQLPGTVGVATLAVMCLGSSLPLDADVFDRAPTIVGPSEVSQLGFRLDLEGNQAIFGSNSSNSALVYQRGPRGWRRTGWLRSDDEAQGFGWSVAISGNNALVGAFLDSSNGHSSGAVYAFARQGRWRQTAKLFSDDIAESDHFGISMAISGDTAIIGASLADVNDGDSGAAYVFRHEGDGLWRQTAKLSPRDGSYKDHFGADIAFDGRTAIIGAPFDSDNQNYAGAAYIFEQIESGNWREVAKLVADEPHNSAYFGADVDISGNRAIVGAGWHDGAAERTGAAYIFAEHPDDTWQQIAMLTASDARENDQFGTVAISGDTAVVGAPRDDDGGIDSGSAYVFRDNGAGEWEELQKLTASSPYRDDMFATVLALSNDTLVAGGYISSLSPSRRSVYVFEALAADFDSNDIVDGDDFLIWANNFGLQASATRRLGDADQDGDVDGDDFLLWQGEFSGPTGPAIQAVPEPSTGALVFTLAITGLSRWSAKPRQNN